MTKRVRDIHTYSKRTYQQAQKVGPEPDLVQRNFTADGPDRLWVADGHPFGRLGHTSLHVTHHQGWVS